MGRIKIKIDKKSLEKFYIKQGLSPYKIAPLVGCSFSTVSSRLKEYGIPLRSRAQAQMRYQRKDFSGNPTEAAYLVGFRLGDLNVYVPKAKKSETIVARCHTTDRPQLQLMKRLFQTYGHVQVSHSEYGYNINCCLNHSFKFLLSKQDRVENWIQKNKKTSAAFFAGYVDAEGNFIINQGRARFKLDSYDRGILSWAHAWLCSIGINARFRKIGEGGTLVGGSMILNRDLWRINVNEAQSLKKFIDLLQPYLKHATRLQQVRSMLRNIEKRIEYGTIKD